MHLYFTLEYELGTVTKKSTNLYLTLVEDHMTFEDQLKT